jgi:TonB family protein
MRTKTLPTTLFIATLLLCSCSNNNPKNQQEGFISIHINDVQRRVEVPLSSLIESLEIIQLEDKDGAFSRSRGIVVSENFIGIRADRDAFKLFERTGQFIGNIGAFGQGSGEYSSNLYHVQICETAERVYLVPWANANRIMTYNLQGQYLPDEAIPFAFSTRKVVFYVDNNNNHVVVVTLPFQGTDEYVVWVQDFEGNAIQTVSSDGFAVAPDFSNEIYSFRNTPNFDFQRMKFHQTEQDTLYHYDIENNVLRPVFTFDAPIKPGELIYTYAELPRHFLIDISVVGRPEISAFGQSITAQSDRLILVDKNTQEAQSIQLRNDFFGNWVIEHPFYRMHNGYFTQSMEPIELKELLDEALKRADLQLDVRQRITELNKSINFDGNDILMIGKLKQNPTGSFNEVEYFETHEKETTAVDVVETIDINRVFSWKDWDARILSRYPSDLVDDYSGWNEYLRAHNQFNDWDSNNPKVVFLRYYIEKNGTSSNIEVTRGSGVEELDNEAILLIRNAPFLPVRTLAGSAVRFGAVVHAIPFPSK